MRHLPIVACVAAVTCGYASVAGATSPLAFTLDLYAPCTTSGCTGIHPTDIALNLGAGSFTYAQDTTLTGSPFVATLPVTTPVICDEISSSGTLGATTNLRLRPSYTNVSPGGALAFNANTVVDIGAVSYDGRSPAGVAASYNNNGSTLPPQVTCYPVNPVSGGAFLGTAGPYGIFASSFEDHFANEPWLSVQTISSPSTTAAKAPATTSSLPTNVMAYVVQIHNASSAVGWHVNLGYDYAFFDASNNGAPYSGIWMRITSAQPGEPAAFGTQYGLDREYVVAASDVQSATDSIYIEVQHPASSTAVANWATLSGALYPTVAAIFPPFGTYPQRLDDKVAVATGNNLPVLNIGSIVASNSTSSTSTTLGNPNGGTSLQVASTTNSMSGSGTVMVDPIVYLVDPNGNTTLPSTAANDGITVSNVSCSDPSGILGGGTVNLTPSSTQGTVALNFNFVPQGNLFKSGTANCQATFTASGHAPALSVTRSFSITMPPAQATHFAVSAPASATAGNSFNNLVVTALDAGNNPVTTYNGTVHFSSNDLQAVLPANATLSGGTGTFSATLRTAGNKSITATDTVTSSITGATSVTVNPAGAASLSIIAPATATTASAFSVTVFAYDAYNNIVTSGYTGTVQITSSDALAILPTPGQLSNGTGSFNVTLNTPGTQTVTAKDANNASITTSTASVAVQ